MFGRLLVFVLLVLLFWSLLVRPSSGSGEAQTYVVRPYDTLWAIAARTYQGDPREGVWRLQRLNGLDGTLLRPGQRLRLP